jgi:hypothetical protein
MTITTNDLPIYCEKCGLKLIIYNKFSPKKEGYDCYTREPLFSQTGLLLKCPKSDGYNEHSFIGFISPDLGNTWSSVYHRTIKDKLIEQLVYADGKYYTRIT